MRRGVDPSRVDPHETRSYRERRACRSLITPTKISNNPNDLATEISSPSEDGNPPNGNCVGPAGKTRVTTAGCAGCAVGPGAADGAAAPGTGAGAATTGGGTG
jgi:hypothetical protein